MKLTAALFPYCEESANKDANHDGHEHDFNKKNAVFNKRFRFGIAVLKIFCAHRVRTLHL